MLLVIFLTPGTWFQILSLFWLSSNFLLIFSLVLLSLQGKDLDSEFWHHLFLMEIRSGYGYFEVCFILEVLIFQLTPSEQNC